MLSNEQFINKMLEDENFKESMQHIEELRNELRNDEKFIEAIIKIGEFKDAIQNNDKLIESLLNNEKFRKDILNMEKFGDIIQSKDLFMQEFKANNNFSDVVNSNKNFKQACLNSEQFGNDLMNMKDYVTAIQSNDKLIEAILSNEKFRKDILNMENFGDAILNSEEFKQEFQVNENFRNVVKHNKRFIRECLNNDEFREDMVNMTEMGKAVQSNKEFIRAYLLQGKFNDAMNMNEHFKKAMRFPQFESAVNYIRKTAKILQNNVGNEDLRKSINNIFWRYEYSIRHFYKYSEHKDSLENLLEVYDEIINKLIDISKELKFQLLSNDETVRKKLFRTAMDNFLTYYHNSNNTIDKQFFHIDYFIEYGDYVYLLKKINIRQLKALKSLYSISYDYGFYAWDFFLKNNIDFILKKCVDEGYDCMLSNVPQFIKKDGDLTDLDIMRISYPEPSQQESRWTNNSKYQLTIYIDPEELVPTNRIKEDVILAIKKCQRSRNVQEIFFCDASKTKIVVQVNIKSKKFTERYVLHRLEKSILAYNLSGSASIAPLEFEEKVKDKKVFNKEIKEKEVLFKKNLDIFLLTTTPPYERRSPATRAIGLWLWDKVHIEKMKPSKAIEAILEKELPAEFNIPKEEVKKKVKNKSEEFVIKREKKYPNKVNIANVFRMLYRELELTEKCIESRSVELLF